jgi:cardiolipin synthase A/B
MTEFVGGNQFSLLDSGTEYFPELEAEIDKASRQIFLQVYIFADDDVGRRIANALARAVERGVMVHLLIDARGGARYLSQLGAAMARSGIQVLHFRPEVQWLSMTSNRLRRMHRKIAVIDGRAAFVGGINIIDDMHTPGHKPPRYDYAVRVEGPLVEAVLDHAHALWSLVAWTTFNQRFDMPIRTSPDDSAKGTQRGAFLVRDNILHRSDIEDAYLEAIESAKNEIFIACAYFFPGRHFRRALVAAAARGVRVVLLLQGRVEYVLLHYASRALYGSLLDAGVEIFEYHASFLHAKVAVIDGRWATVGSSNIDPFSLLLAREANVVVDDDAFASGLKQSLVEHMEKGAARVGKQQWRKRPLTERVLIWVGYGIARLLIGVFGYGRLH